MQFGNLHPQECAVIGLFCLLIFNYVRFIFFWDGFYYPRPLEIKGDLAVCSDRKPDFGVQLCDIFPKDLDLKNPSGINITYQNLYGLPKELGIQPGGRWCPSSCSARHQIALVIPLRGRHDQLQVFLNHMHRFLQKQLLDYQIFVIEQKDEMPFNRGKLFNVGYNEINKIRPFCCFIFSDVDLLPQSPMNMYACSKNPRHLSVSVNTFRYVLTYETIFGGVISMSGKHFESVNGFSNRFFGWGGEDDDLFQRLRSKGYMLSRWPAEISRYTMLQHSKEESNPNRYKLLDGDQTQENDDGLSTLQYKLLKTDELPLYTRFVVSLDPT